MHFGISSLYFAAVVALSRGQYSGRLALRGSFDDVIQLYDSTSDEFCDVDDSQRDECGFPGIKTDGCLRIGCCWRQSNVQGAPWCFYNNNPVCAVSDGEREECGYPGIKRDQCVTTDGCCWAKGDGPWCFKAKSGIEPGTVRDKVTCQVDETSRDACGDKGISARDCHLKGCCYAEASDADAPFCFHGEDPSKVEEHKHDYGVSEDRLTCDSSSLATDLDRKECGFQGMGAAECQQKGCCWRSSQVHGAPWCFYKIELPKEGETTPTPKSDAAIKTTSPIPFVSKTGKDTTCSVPDEVRHECGFQGIHSDQCLQRGCCWMVAELMGAPWCFNATKKSELNTGLLENTLAEVENDAECQMTDEDREECGYPGMHHEECIERNCCWVPADDPSDGAPFCFNRSKASKKSPSSDETPDEHDKTCAVPDQGRTECGFPGIHSEACLARGCCWRTSEMEGVPWCFGKATEKAVEETEYCYVDEADRHECGFDGMHADECRKRGCCWVPATTDGVPWCFMEASKPKITTAVTTTVATTSSKSEMEVVVADGEASTTMHALTTTLLKASDPDLEDFLAFAAPSIAKDKDSAEYRELVSRCQGWLKNKFLTISWLAGLKGNSVGTQNVFLKSCFQTEQGAIQKGTKYFNQKSQGDALQCKWKQTWDSAGLELPISVGIALLMLSIGVCQWRTEDTWAEERQAEEQRQQKRLNEAKAAADERARQKQAARDQKMSEYENTLSTLRSEHEKKVGEIKGRNEEKAQQRELRRQQEQKREEDKRSKKQARDLEIQKAKEQEDEERAAEAKRQEEAEKERQRIAAEEAKRQKKCGWFPGCGKSGKGAVQVPVKGADSPSTNSSSQSPPPGKGYSALTQGSDEEENLPPLDPIDEDENLPSLDTNGLGPPASRENSEDPGPLIGDDSPPPPSQWYGPHYHRVIDYLCAAAVLIYTIHHSIAYGTLAWAAPFLVLSAACVLVPCAQYLNDLSFSQYITSHILLELIAMLLPVVLRFFDFFAQPPCKLPILYLYILEGVIAFDLVFFKLTNCCCFCNRKPPE